LLPVDAEKFNFRSLNVELMLTAMGSSVL